MDWKRTLPYASLVVIVCLVYAASLRAPFIYDDMDSVVGNMSIRSVWPLAQSMWDARPHDPPTKGRPLPNFSFALNYAMGGIQPAVYHATNVAIHAMNAMLLLGLLRVLAQPGKASGRRLRWAAWWTWGVVAVWAVHPLQVDAVLYVSQRTTLLVSLFMLLTLLCAVRAWRHASQRVRWLAGSAAVLFSVAAACSKETAYALPLVLLLAGAADAGGLRWGDLKKRVPLCVLVTFACWGSLAGLMMAAPRSTTIGVGLGVTPWESLNTQAGVLCWYFSRVVWPVGMTLCHEWTIVRETWGGLWPGLLILAFLAASLLLWWRRPRVGWPLLAGWLLLAPTSSFIAIVTEIAAERRMYLPSFAIILVLAWCVWRVMAYAPRSSRSHALGRWVMRQPRRVGGVLCCLMIVVGGVTLSRVTTLTHNVAVWTEARAVYPHSHLILDKLGRAYFDERQDVATAKAMWERVLEMKPMYWPTNNNMGRLMMQEGDRAAAREHFERVLQVHPNDAYARNMIGVMIGMGGDLAGSEQHLRETLNMHPTTPLVYVNLGVTLYRQGKRVEAKQLLVQALRLDPTSEDALEFWPKMFPGEPLP